MLDYRVLPPFSYEVSRSNTAGVVVERVRQDVFRTSFTRELFNNDPEGLKMAQRRTMVMASLGILLSPVFSSAAQAVDPDWQPPAVMDFSGCRKVPTVHGGADTYVIPCTGTFSTSSVDPDGNRIQRADWRLNLVADGTPGPVQLTAPTAADPVTDPPGLVVRYTYTEQEIYIPYLQVTLADGTKRYNGQLGASFVRPENTEQAPAKLKPSRYVNAKTRLVTLVTPKRQMRVYVDWPERKSTGLTADGRIVSRTRIGERYKYVVRLPKDAKGKAVLTAYVYNDTRFTYKYTFKRRIK